VTLPRPSLYKALLPALALFLLLVWKLDFLCDDSFISFRYSKNFAAGHGLRYNLGFDQPVEGYSNFLWVAWLSIFEWLGWDITLWSRLSSTACGVVLLVWIVRHAQRRLELSAAGTLATGLFCASLPPIALWATGGLATMPTALFVFGAYERLLGDPERPRGGQAGIFAALAGLVRADGAAWILMLLVCAALSWLLTTRKPELRVAIVQTTLLLVIAVGAHVAWRYNYYGDYLPNTARVKAGFSIHRLQRGGDYAIAYLLTVPCTALLFLLSVRRWKTGLCQLWLPAVLVSAGTLAYSVWVGGDFMPMGRFLFPAIFFTPLLFAAVIAHWTPAGRGIGPAAAVLSVVCVSVNVLGCLDINVVPESVRQRFHFRQDRKWESEVSMRGSMKERAQEWSLQGKALARVVKPGETMMLGAIGAQGYYSGLDMYDNYGLVTPEVIDAVEPIERSSPGHDRRVGTKYFIKKRPTFAGSVMSTVDASEDDQLGNNWKTHFLRPLVHIERYPLPVEDGFEEGSELHLLRFHRWE